MGFGVWRNLNALERLGTVIDKRRGRGVEFGAGFPLEGTIPDGDFHQPVWRDEFEGHLG
jgi:hypothetical protein